MTAFVCLCLTPADFDHPNIAIAASRAGGIGIIDLEFCRDWEQARHNVQQLQSKTQGALGLRFHLQQTPQAIALLEGLEGLEGLSARPQTLIVSGNPTAEWPVGLLPQANRQVLLEIIHYPAFQAIAPERLAAFSGLIAKGHEAGGWVGEDSAFILSQKLLPTTALPVYIQGGISLHNSAACRVAGAAGVVLDDQLLLMPESALPTAWKAHLHTLNGQEAIGIGEPMQATCRVLSRPGFAVIERLQQQANQLELEFVPDNLPTAQQQWQQQANPLIGWGQPGQLAWPIGQAVGLAATIQQRHQSSGHFIQALQQASQNHINSAYHARALQPDSVLAKAHHTHYPIVQGPMTRVSDSAEFALAVAEAGALPLLALALMRYEPVKALLTKTQELLGQRSWGVGMLGFVSQHLREQQLKAIAEVKPGFALIAGGRPDQAAQFEQLGIHTYIHAPVPRLLKLFLEQGARKFVFEGRECGGHVGPLNSFALWESMIEVLLHEVPAGQDKTIHVLFAGGIHDARSTAMVSAMTAPLSARGMKVGVLMGSAYLFTDEIVSSGAILPQFQQQAIACQATINLESGPGHASRCAITPFAYEFYATRRQLMREGKAHEEIKDALEDLNLGRLRAASKGTQRDPTQDGKLITLSPEAQLQEGMYMIGQVATLRHHALQAKQLHEEVSVQSETWLQAAATSTAQNLACGTANQPSDIAIIGIGTLLPKAQEVNTYWKNILDAVDAITEVPESRWDWKLYYDADRNARDKVYSKWGGFLDDVVFDPLFYGIPPTALKSIEPMQLLALEVVRRALEDSGLRQGKFDRENTAVIFGAGGGLGDLGLQYGMRTEIPRYVDKPSEAIWDRLPEWTEESFAGCLLNVVAGRVANRFNLGGMNCTVDAACASSLAAIHIAINELESGRANVAFAGGVDAVQSPFGFTCFSKTTALSPRGRSHTFDENSDGIAISEGLAVIVMKRLADAEQAGDRIYAVIKASGASSDGKALGLTAPLPAGQMRALHRVYAKAGYSPATLGLVEAHGTGTAAGDRAETETVINTLKAHQAPAKSCVLGSVKTMIGHTKASAGVAGLIKVALALHHKVLPPHAQVKTPIAPIRDPASPVYLLQQPRPWFAHGQHPRRAGVSAFGFGGTNFHVTLEEYQNEYRSNLNPAGADYWPHELVILRAADKTTLQQAIERLQQALQAGAKPRLADLAYSHALKAETDASKPACIAFIVASLTELGAALQLAINYLKGDKTPLPPSIKLHLLPTPADAANKIAFIFPGQGSQYVNMGRELALYLPAMRHAIEAATDNLHAQFAQPLDQLIFPPSAYSPEETQAYQEHLTQTQIAQPAIGAISVGYLQLMQQLGVCPDLVAGHSYGEYTALHAAGVLSQADFFQLSAIRGQVMAAACQLEPTGAMAAIKLEREQLEPQLSELTDVTVANHNAPKQTVITGPKAQVEKLVDSLNAQDISARMLAVAGAFHSPLMEPAQEPLHQAIAQAEFHPATVPVYSNTTTEPYPASVNHIREQLSNHMLNPVEFVQQILRMYSAGTRVFIELGPKRILTGLVGQILRGKEHLGIAVDDGNGSLQGWLTALGVLAVHSIPFQVSALFAGRTVKALDLTRLVETTSPPPLAKTTWLINGGSSRPQAETVGKTGKLPPITASTRPQVEQAYLHSLAAELPMPTAPLPTPQPPTPQQPTPQPAPAPMPMASAVQPPTMAAVMPSLAGNTEIWASYQQTMQQFLTLQERVMQQFLGGVTMPSAPLPLPTPALPEVAPPVMPPVMPQPTLASPPPLPATVAPVAPAVVVQVAPALDRAALTATLLKLVSERTGYPEDMLGLEQDMEAELGIDSIKRVEILGALQKVVPPELAAHIRSDMETFTRVKSLQALLTELLQAMPASAPATPSVAPTPAASTPSSAPAVATLSRDELQARLLTLVSERTGYPEDMLGLEQDMEAELGIDSIKRVEILGALQKVVPPELAAHIRSEMETFTRVKSLQALLTELLQAIPTQAPAAPSAAPTPAVTAPSAPIVAATLSRAELQARLLTLVSERTGYPEDMLGLEQDMEAELGIDSIKRVEILGALQKVVPPELATQIRNQMETFTRVKSLQALLNELLGGLAPEPVSTPAAVVIAEPVAPVITTPAPSTIPRYRMQAYPGHLPDITLAPMTGFYVLTEDGQGLANEVAAQIEKRGAQAWILDAHALATPDKLESSLQEARRQHGPVTGLIHLAAMIGLELPASLAHWREYTHYQGKALYLLCKLCQADLQKHGKIVAASLLGGYFGRQRPTGSGLPSGGAHTGFLKSLAAEWPTLQAKALDFADGLAPEAMAEIIIHELLTPDAELEIGYTENQRILFRTTAAPLTVTDKPLTTPTADWVVLVTGGARGITAELAKDLAQYRLTLILAGRSPQPEAEDNATLGLEDIHTLRKLFIQQIKAKHQNPTPALVDSHINQLFRDREIRQNLAAFASSGARVEYRALDVTHEADMQQLLAQIYQHYGRLDAVLHGAGIIEDKLVVDKTPASFFRVYDTKVDSAYLLARYLQPDSLKLLVFFTSVAGRYGNRGQADYASANETVNRLAWRLDEQWPSRVVAINWGPWDTAGMASEEVKRQFEARGVQAIALNAGRHFFTQELAYGQKGEVEIIAGAGPWGHETIPHANPLDTQPNTNLSHFVLLSQQPQAQPNGTVTLNHTFSLTTEPYLADHRLNQNPVVPAAGAIAWMAEFVQAAWPEWVVTQVRDVTIFKGLVLDQARDRPVIFKARASSHADAESLQVAVEITNPQQGMAYYRASLILEPQLPPAPIADYTPLTAGIVMDVETVYTRCLFHGLRFHRIAEFNRMHEQGIDVQVTPSDPSDWVHPAKPQAHWLFDPGLLDTGPQLAMVWSRLQQDISALPSYFKAIKRYGNTPLTGPLKLVFRVKPADNPQAVAYDALYIDAQGYLRLWIENGESTGSAQLNRLADDTDQYGRPRAKAKTKS